MTKIGSVLEGKYEILKEIGHGGMSTVYLAMDKRLNKQWAVKEIRKLGGSKDEIIVNSLLAEANMMKKLDHAALPRIVDIIDNGVTIYVVMDYIEGESLDKYLLEFGPQPEELVISWAKQLCDALSYLHSQKPPIIYRDMKPGNVMLKPEGNIKIIDFGIAREYKEQKLSDTTVLGTRGYAPPEQYSGQTDPRSDIFALGMTMHHLLTGIDPRSGEAYASVRKWNPELSEGIELIVDKCVEPVAENRYQSCADLLYDLEHPELITKGFKRKQKIRLGLFLASAILSVVMAVAGVIFNFSAKYVNNQDYDVKVNSSDTESYYQAVKIYPGRVTAYEKLIDYYKNYEATNEQINKVGNIIETNGASFNVSGSDVATMYYDIGKLYFSVYDGTFKERALRASNFFKKAVENETEFDKREIAECYYSICNFMNNLSPTKEHVLSDYTTLFAEIEKAMPIVDKATDSESNYDKITLYYAVMLFARDQAEHMASVNFNKSDLIEILQDIKKKSNAITSTLNYVNELKDKIVSESDSFIEHINAKYDEVEKRQQGGN